MAGGIRALAGLLAACVLAGCLSPEEDEFITGKVLQVTDGQTLTILVESGQGQVRLAGRRSQQSLWALCAGKDARVQIVGIDGRGAALGRVWCSGVEVSAAQVEIENSPA